jgi:hypothetical protein
MPKMFYFAWIEEGEAFDPDVHDRLDENVFSHKFNQQEGSFATLAIEVKNPRIGLLNPGRSLWCYYSFDDGEGNITPLFKGRLIGIPDNIFDTVITMQFLARPSDFVAQKEALADTLRVRPYWDQLLISPDSWADPDTVLEARSALWHIDPVTHEVTISDVLAPEDGVMEFTAGQFLRDGMALQLQQVPLRRVQVDVTFPWENSAEGNIDIIYQLLQAYPDKDPVYQMIYSYTFEGLSQDWPKAGAKIGDGWTVASGELVDMSYRVVKPIRLNQYFDTSSLRNQPVEQAVVFEPKISGRVWGGVDGAGYDTNTEIVIANPGWGRPSMTIDYATSRDYAQVLSFAMESDVQSILTEASEDEAMLITLTSNKLTDVGYLGEIAIDRGFRTFLDRPRGLEAVEHCLLIARAALCIRARAVHITFQAPFMLGMPASLRKGALVHDPRLPGGEALGKIIEYSHESDGGTNAPLTTIIIGCAIGKGGSHTTDAGTGVYAAPGYMAPGYQQMKNVIVATPTSDITYEMPETVNFDDGLDITGLRPQTAIKSLSVINGPSVQRAAIEATRLAEGIGDQSAVASALQALPTQFQLELVPLNTGPHIGGVQPAVSMLIIPKQIDLEAASA